MNLISRTDQKFSIFSKVCRETGHLGCMLGDEMKSAWDHNYDLFKISIENI